MRLDIEDMSYEVSPHVLSTKYLITWIHTPHRYLKNLHLCLFILLTFKSRVVQEPLALSDHIGTVNTGLSEEDAKGLLQRRLTSLSYRINMEEAPSIDLETDYCTLCQVKPRNLETSSSKLMQTFHTRFFLIGNWQETTRTKIRSQRWTANTSIMQNVWKSG